MATLTHSLHPLPPDLSHGLLDVDLSLRLLGDEVGIAHGCHNVEQGGQGLQVAGLALFPSL